MVLDDTTDMVWLAENLLHFYRHESCGKCTPCREGTDWLFRLLQPADARARARRRTSRCSKSVADNINGKTLCAFGDAAATPVLTTLKWFGAEYEAYVKRQGAGAGGLSRAKQPVGAH